MEDLKVGDWIAHSRSRSRSVRLKVVFIYPNKRADLQTPMGRVLVSKPLDLYEKVNAPAKDAFRDERMRLALLEHDRNELSRFQAKSRLNRPGQEDCGFKSPNHPSFKHDEERRAKKSEALGMAYGMKEPHIAYNYYDKEVRTFAHLTSTHNEFDDKRLEVAIAEMTKIMNDSFKISPEFLGIHAPIHKNCRSISIPLEEVMHKVISKLNGQTKGVELEQAVSEDKTLKVSLHTILKNCEQVKDMKLGEEAVLTGLAIHDGQVVFAMSQGKVEKVDSEIQF